MGFLSCLVNDTEHDMSFFGFDDLYPDFYFLFWQDWAVKNEMSPGIDTVVFNFQFIYSKAITF